MLSSARNGDFLHGAEPVKQSLGGVKSRWELGKEGEKTKPNHKLLVSCRAHIGLDVPF